MKVMNGVKVLVLVAMGTVGLSLGALAADQSSGCGLGWSVTQKMSLFASSTRTTTNGIGSEPSAMTSGTSGCAKHSIATKEKEQTYFTELNYQNLAIEMAKGNGEYLQAFSRVMGCSADSFPGFSAVMQSHYPQIFTGDSATPVEVLQNVRKQLETHSELSSTCQSVVL